MQAAMHTYYRSKRSIPFGTVKIPIDLHTVDAFEIDFFVDWGRCGLRLQR
jgi:hypothetical protein